MKPNVLLAGLLAAALLAVGCGPGAGRDGPESALLARVNGESISVDQLNHRMRFLGLGFHNLSGAGSEGAGKLEALSQLIDESVCLQEARRLGIAATGAEVDARINELTAELPESAFKDALSKSGLTIEDIREATAVKLTIEKLIKAEVYSRMAADDSQLRGFFEEHRKEFGRPEQVKARQIVVATEQEARAVLDELRRGADFSDMARSRSMSPDSEYGGDLGYFSRGEMPPEFEDAVFGMKPGQMSGIVQSPYGYHIFLVDDVTRASNPAFEEAKQAVKERFLASRGEEAYLAWRSALRDGATIEVYKEALDKL